MVSLYPRGGVGMPNVVGSYIEGDQARRRNVLAQAADRRARDALSMQREQMEFGRMDADRRFGLDEQRFGLQERAFEAQEARARAAAARAAAGAQRAAANALRDEERAELDRITKTIAQGRTLQERVDLAAMLLDEEDQAEFGALARRSSTKGPVHLYDDIVLNAIRVHGGLDPLAVEDPTEFDLREVNGRLAYVPKQPGRGDAVFVGGAPEATPEPDVKGEGDLRKEFSALTKEFRAVDDAFGRISASAKNPTPAGDLSMLFNYMKMLDPGSVVRESEFRTAETAAPLLERIGISFDKVKSVWEGRRLTPAQRSDFLNRAAELYGEARSTYETTTDQYRRVAEAYGFDTDRAVVPREVRTLPDFPDVGTVEDGYIYNGGDPADPASWSEVAR